MSDSETPDTNVADILDRAEARVIAQVARDVELMGPLDEHEVREKVKAMPTGIRAPLLFAVAGLPAIRRTWADQDRTSLGEGFAQMILRSVACFMGTEDFSELVGIGRVYGESDALLTYVLGVAD